MRSRRQSVLGSPDEEKARPSQFVPDRLWTVIASLSPLAAISENRANHLDVGRLRSRLTDIWSRRTAAWRPAPPVDWAGIMPGWRNCPTASATPDRRKIGFQRRGPHSVTASFLRCSSCRPAAGMAALGLTTRPDPLAGGQQHMARVVAALEPHRLVRDRQLDSEFLRLAVGPAHQRHAGNAGREAEIIFDPRRRARLPAERAAVDRQHRQPFRAGVDRVAARLTGR